MPKKAIKSIADESFTSIKTFYNKQLSSGDVTFTLPENEQFTTLDNENYNLTIVTGSNSHRDMVGHQVLTLTLRMNPQNNHLLSQLHLVLTDSHYKLLVSTMVLVVVLTLLVLH